MNPSIQSYLLNIGSFMGILASVALVYILVLGGLGWLLSHWRGGEMFCTLWLSVVFSIVIAVIAVPLFEGIVGLFRYDPPADAFFGLGRIRQDGTYKLTARITFFALYGLLVVLGFVVGYVHTRRMNQSKTIGTASGLAVFFFLTVTMPLVDFVNACNIGEPFLLPMSC